MLRLKHRDRLHFAGVGTCWHYENNVIEHGKAHLHFAVYLNPQPHKSSQLRTIFSNNHTQSSCIALTWKRQDWLSDNPGFSANERLCVKFDCITGRERLRAFRYCVARQGGVGGTIGEKNSHSAAAASSLR
eukprot:1432433-Pleurochrysis_carterae.AAC.1